jgi:CO/xanthine dehydrogenase FAD-binding subunit
MGAKTVFFARNLPDAIMQLQTTAGLKVMAGCTLSKTLPPSSLCLRPGSIADLAIIEPHERYMECGSGVTLSSILAAAKRRLPSAFFEAVESIATPFVRNLATIGGNVCAQGHRRTLFPVLLALDARLEFRSQNEIRLTPIGKFQGVPSRSILTKIRVPVDEWDISVFKRLGPSRVFNEESGGFVFLAMTEKGILSDLRIAFSRETAYRSRELENRLIGMRLPLSQKTIYSLLDETAERIANSAIDAPEHSLIDTPNADKQFLTLLEAAMGELM